MIPCYWHHTCKTSRRMHPKKRKTQFAKKNRKYNGRGLTARHAGPKGKHHSFCLSWRCTAIASKMAMGEKMVSLTLRPDQDSLSSSFIRTLVITDSGCLRSSRSFRVSHDKHGSTMESDTNGGRANPVL
eukprot:1142087-Pelagomonas_calceolata.AAC.2